MAQFDVYRNADIDSVEEFPYLLDIQAELLEPLATRIIVPLSSQRYAPKPLAVLNPEIRVVGETLIALFDELFAYPKAKLGEKVGNLGTNYRREIQGAMDFLMRGY